MKSKKTTRPSRAVSRYLANLGSRGGKSAAQKMTAEERSERARKAARARFPKPKGGVQ